MKSELSRKSFLRLAAGGVLGGATRAGAAPAAINFILDSANFRHYVDEFNSYAKEEVVNFIPDSEAWTWMHANVPFFACPDRDIEQIYYYRWWTFRKNIKKTPDGFIITEFLKPVKHAADYNSLSCAFGHHVAEGRWLRDRQFLEQDIFFWLRSGENGGLRKNFHQFSGWAADALHRRWLVDGNREALVSYLDALLLDYDAWKRERLTDSGLFWQRDVSDGMESSISGGRKVKNLRPSINSYMYGNAKAIAAIAALADRKTVANEYAAEAARLKKLVQARLWNGKLAFFDTRLENGEFAGVRENIGYTPWYFGLPDDRMEYAAAWKQLMDPNGFYAPFGPTTAERRHPQFQIPYEGDDCQWNGPSWPFATTITLKALANLITGYRQNAATRDDYFQTFLTYTKSQHLKLDRGRVIPWIDEDLNPLTGEWLARAMKIQKKTFYGRGDYYNHSGYCDLVITGLAGLRPRGDEIVEVDPMLPSGKWDWFCLDGVPYHGRTVTVMWDQSGDKFGKGKGLRVFADGKEIVSAPRLTRVTGRLI